ncbi:hypothetical protein JCM10296v2_005309 [Rhodotorula toruloides]
MPFFQAPLRLDEYQRASSAFPAASSSSADRGPDSPSPNKKRRVDSVPAALGGRRNSAGASGSSSPAPRSAAAARKSEGDAARRAEINARYEELTRDQARLQATLRLQDAWEDIQRRHSTMPGSGTPAPRARAASVGGGTPRRHRPGRSRAIPVEEDDIIDLSTLDFVEDRGILRNSKAGGFAIGAYGGTGTEDIVVGLDTAGADDDGTEGDEDEEEEEELEDYTDSDAESYTSEDELGELDELPSQPSLVFREERRKEAERLKEVLEFQQQEALARGASAQPSSSRATPRPGNETLPTPVAAAEDDDLDLFATPPPPASAPRRPQSSSPRVSPAKTPQRTSQPPSRPSSSTSTIRRAVDHFHLASPAPSSSRAKSRPLPSSPSSRAFSAPPKPLSRGKAAGLPTPPSSFAARRASQQARPSRPPPSTSPLREVIYINSPSPSPSPAPEPRLRRRSPSPELFGDMPSPARRGVPPEVIAGPSTSKQKQVFQRPTPTPTPPPPRPAPPSAAAFSLTPAQPANPPDKPRTKPRQHSFELIIDVPARGSRAPPKVQASKSMPNLASMSEADKPVSRRTSGLSTPPLSKGPKDAPRSASTRPAPSSLQKANPSKFAPTPTEVLPAPPKLPASAMDDEEDELLLSSPTKPSSAAPARRLSLPPPSSRASVGPSDRKNVRGWTLAGKKTSSSGLGGRDVFAEDDDSEDEFGNSLSSASFVLAALIYLLSPSHFLTLIFRLALQIQFVNPRRVHPERSLRFFVALWGVQAAVAAVGHGLLGSQGTKGRLGYVQRGVMLDFVGQVVTPSTFHLVALDIVLAALQLATLLVAFGATVPSDLDSSSSGEAGRDYGPLLGIDEEEVFDEEEVGEEAGPGGRRRRRSRNGYESVELEDEEEDGQWIGGAADAYGPSSAKPSSPFTSSAFSTSSSSALSSSRYTRIPLIADFRLRTVWTEIARSSPSRTEVEDRGVEAMEEGRAAG